MSVTFAVKAGEMTLIDLLPDEMTIWTGPLREGTSETITDRGRTGGTATPTDPLGETTPKSRLPRK